MRYSVRDAFQTFPFPEGFEKNSRLEVMGKEYYDFRAPLMVRNNEGLTKTYNRFHSQNEHAPGIVRLRALHAAMDIVVLRAYGWDDLAGRANAEFIEQDTDEDESSKARLDWPVEFKDTVLARLFVLHARRPKYERAAGVERPSDEEIEERESDGLL